MYINQFIQFVDVQFLILIISERKHYQVENQQQ